MHDQEFMSAVLQSLPGVDLSDPQIRNALQGFSADDENNEEDNKKDDEKKKQEIYLFCESEAITTCAYNCNRKIKTFWTVILF